MKPPDSGAPTTAMTSRQQGLIVLIVMELLVVFALMGRQWLCPTAPRPNLARLPASTASDLRRLQARTRSNYFLHWRELGEAYLAYGYFVEAEACLRHASMRQPHDFGAAYGRAYSLDRMGRLTEANSQFETALELADPAMALACRYHIGRNRLRAEHAAGAEEIFSQLQGFPAADHQRAKLLVSQGRAKAAVPLIIELEALDRDELEVQSLAIQAERSLGMNRSVAQRARQLEWCHHALRLTDHWEYLQPIRARYGLSALLGRVETSASAGQFVAAASKFEALQREHDLETLVQLLGRGAEIELRAGRIDQALKTLQTLSDRQSLPLPWRHLWADVLHHAGQSDKAREAWEAANRLQSKATSHEQLAAAWNALGDDARSRRETALAQQTLGIEAFRQNQLTVALKALETSTQLAPAEARSWFYLGETRLALGQAAVASEAFRECVRLAPEHGRAASRLE